MADYSAFREQLGIRLPTCGHALWDPRPEEPGRPVKSATLDSYARTNSIFYSMPCLPKASKCQGVSKNLSPSHHIAFPRNLSVADVTALTESEWFLNVTSTHLPVGNCSSQYERFIADIVSAQTAPVWSRFSAQGIEEVQYHPSQ